MVVYTQRTSYYIVQSETGAQIRVRGLHRAEAEVARQRAKTGDVWFYYVDNLPL